jgi:hypothetical protein
MLYDHDISINVSSKPNKYYYWQEDLAQNKVLKTDQSSGEANLHA